MLASEPSARPTAAEALETFDATLPEANERPTEQRTDLPEAKASPCSESDPSTASGAYLEESSFEGPAAAFHDI